MIPTILFRVPLNLLLVYPKLLIRVLVWVYDYIAGTPIESIATGAIKLIGATAIEFTTTAGAIKFTPAVVAIKLIGAAAGAIELIGATANEITCNCW